MDYRTEFPDFDPATMPAIPATWIDLSWRREAHPSFQAARSLAELEHGGWRIYVFVDWLDPKRRSTYGALRFSVWFEADRPTNGNCLLETDDWTELLAAIPRFAAQFNADQKGA